MIFKLNAFNLTKFLKVQLKFEKGIEMSLSKLDPDWQAAQIHGIATIPGIVNPQKQKNGQLICPCCLNIIHKEPAPICGNSKQLEFLGFGFPLFYVFLKYCILLLFLSDCCFNGIELYWSIKEGDINCKRIEGCTSIMVKLARIQADVSGEEILVRVLSYIVQICVLIYIRDLIIKTRNYYDQRTCSLSDYSLMIRDLPKRKGTKKNLVNFLKDCFAKAPYHVTFLPQYEAFYEMQQSCNQITLKIKEAMRLPESQSKEKQIKELKRQLTKRQKKLEQYCENQLKLEQNDEVIAEKLIFSCETEDDKFHILQKFKQISEEKLRDHFQISPQENCLIKIDQAPEPKEIKWQHINYPSHKRIVRMFIGWLLTLAFLATITLIFFLALSQKSELILRATSHSQTSDNSSHGSSYGLAISIVYIAILCVILFNKFIMGMVLHKICAFQMHQTTAQEQFHFALKYSVGLFFTTALMTLAVEDIKFNNFYTHPYGVIEQETVMFIMNAFFVPLIWLINPWQLHVLIKRKMNYLRKDLTQKQANKIMENVQYNMGKRYAQVLEIMWFTYLYSSLIPIGGLFSTIGLCLYYWVDKYNLLRRSSVNSNVAGELSIQAMKLLDFTLICKPLGEIVFDRQIRNQYNTSSFAMLGIGILYLLLPIDSMLEYFHPQKFNNEEKHLQEVEHNFRETYQTLHPIFSLKKQNKDKLFAAFKILDYAIANEQDSVRQHEQIEVQSFHQSNQSPQQMPTASPFAPFKDSTNILQTLFLRQSSKACKQKDIIDNESDI